MSLLVIGVIVIIAVLFIFIVYDQSSNEKFPKSGPSSKFNSLDGGMYNLIEKYDKADDFKDPNKWRLYAGRIDYGSPAASEGLLSKDFYWNIGDPALNLNNVKDLGNSFDWTFLSDPTGGIQNYMVGAANADILIADNDDQVEIKVMKFQNTTDARSGGAAEFGLASIRVETTDTYNGGVFVLDAEQVPNGCGAWPAFWTNGTSSEEEWKSPNNIGGGINSLWPKYGEIDILEQVNNAPDGHFTLHAAKGCMTEATGDIVSNDCNSGGDKRGFLNGSYVPPGEHDATSGCSITIPDIGINGKGVYICEWVKPNDLDMMNTIKFWYFPSSNNTPVTDFYSSGDINSLGNPMAIHRVDGKYFINQRIVLNFVMCGDWAGSLACSDDRFSFSGGDKQQCNNAFSTWLETENSNPSGLIDINNPDDPRLDRYKWIINSLRIYS